MLSQLLSVDEKITLKILEFITSQTWLRIAKTALPQNLGFFAQAKIS